MLRVVLMVSIGWLAISLPLAVRYDNFYKNHAIEPDTDADGFPDFTKAEFQLEQSSSIALRWWFSGGIALVVAEASGVRLFVRSFGRPWLIETFVGLLLVCAGLSYARLLRFRPRIVRGFEGPGWSYALRAEDRAWTFLFVTSLALAVILVFVYWKGWIARRSSISHERGFDVIPK
jgi:hypothetical protein